MKRRRFFAREHERKDGEGRKGEGVDRSPSPQDANRVKKRRRMSTKYKVLPDALEREAKGREGKGKGGTKVRENRII